MAYMPSVPAEGGGHSLALSLQKQENIPVACMPTAAAEAEHPCGRCATAPGEAGKCSCACMVSQNNKGCEKIIIKLLSF